MLVGGVAGFMGGWVDDVLMRVTELFQLLPRFFLAILVAALFGSSIFIIVVLLALTFWPATARLLRGQVLSLRTREFVFAARATGAREWVIFARHVLPNALPPVMVSTALQIGGAILVEAGLSFLGLGDRSLVSWGYMLNNAQPFIQTAWWMSIFPGLMLLMTVVAVNLVGDGLNEVFDPHA
jgi:peptide/nickel transport system permease protein